MNSQSEKSPAGAGRARWIAAGFVGAFAASVLTVIYTGLMVEGRPGEFDAGFRSITLAPGETREIELRFESPAAFETAQLRLSLPGILEPAGRGDAAASLERTVAVAPGANVYAVSVRALAAGGGYLEARLTGEAPIALERVFVTVAADPARDP